MISPRHRPLAIRHQTLKNRVVVPPMASQTADAKGLATPATLEHYERLARSGAGLIMVEYSFVHSSGRGEPNQLGVHDDSTVEGLTEIARRLHLDGALAGLQLVHVGGKSTSELTGAPLMGPSAVPVPVKERELETPRAMNSRDIENLISWFVEAAGRARQAGFDLVELHAAHGYGLNQWLSPLTNQRTPQAGESGLDILIKIIQRVRAAWPELLIAVRLAAQDHLPGGLTLNDTRLIARELELHGLDVLDVSSGIGGWRRPEGRVGEGYLVGDASALKQAVGIPVIGVGGIETGSFIDGAVAKGDLDLAAVGRAILRDPETWRRDQLEGTTSR